MDQYKIDNVEQLIDLWKGVYSNESGVDWSNLLLYYDNNIVFKDTIQELKGIDEFTAMTERLGKRSRNLEYVIHNSTKE